MAVNAIKTNNPYWQKFGMLTVQPRVQGPEPVAGRPLSVGVVAGEDGITPTSQGAQGVGLGTTYAEGAGAHYTNGKGHSLHTTWFVG